METSCFYDKETKWLHSGGEVYVCPPGGVGNALFHKMKEYAAKGLIFQSDAETGKEETFEEFLQKCIKIALFLKKKGLEKGDIISMCSQNNAYNLAVLFAVYFNGIIIASTDPLTSVADAKYLMGLVEPKLMFACSKSIDVSTKAIEGKGIELIPLFEHESLENLPAILEKFTEEDVKSFVPYYAEDLKEIISMHFSSGTTGMPKASCFNHYMIFANIRKDMQQGDRYTILTTLYWSTTLQYELGVAFAGAIRVYITQSSPETVWQYIAKSKASCALISYGFCMQSIPHLKDPLSHLRLIFLVGGTLPRRCHDELKQKLPHTILCRIYGATEIGMSHFNAGQSVPESAGHLVPKQIILKIVNVDTEQSLGLNEVGEVRIKGRYQLSGYYKRDDVDIWDAEGFYQTGDLGYVNEKYELFIVDRIKEMFKYRGYHVIPEKLEGILLAHPAVKLAIVIPVPNLTDDSHAKGLIVLKDGCTVGGDEMVKFVNEKLEDPRDHLRAGVQIISDEDISYTPTNKINRRLMKQKFMS